MMRRRKVNRESRMALRKLGVETPRLSFRDLVLEASAGVGRRLGRTLSTAVGTVLGVGAFVATLGVAATAAQQVTEMFDAMRATEVIVEGASLTGYDDVFPPDAEERILQLSGVSSAGIMFTMGGARTSANPLANTDGDDTVVLSIVGATPGALETIHASVITGRLYDQYHELGGESVALLGESAASLLGVTNLVNRPAVFVRGHAVTVIGIIGDVSRRPDVLMSVVVPTTTALRLSDGGNSSPLMIIETAPGAAETIAIQAPLVLKPESPHELRAVAPPDPQRLRRQVEDDVNALFLVLAGIALAVGTLSIANTSLVSVLERTTEIGLRRALGARPRHIGLHLLTETAITGALGGILGASLGVIAVVVIAAVRSWTPILEPIAVVLGPLLGAFTGIVAGVQPAIRASRVQPNAALRL